MTINERTSFSANAPDILKCQRQAGEPRSSPEAGATRPGIVGTTVMELAERLR